MGAPALFVHVPRTAGSSVGHYFMYQSSVQTLWKGVTLHDTIEGAINKSLLESCPTLIGGHFPVRDIPLNSLPLRLPIVACVRDPVDRLVSHYIYARDLIAHEHKLHITGDFSRDIRGSYSAVIRGESMIQFLSTLPMSAEQSDHLEDVKANIANSRLCLFEYTQIGNAIKKTYEVLGIDAEDVKLTPESIPRVNVTATANPVAMKTEDLTYIKELLREDYMLLAHLQRIEQ